MTKFICIFGFALACSLTLRCAARANADNGYNPYTDHGVPLDENTVTVYLNRHGGKVFKRDGHGAGSLPAYGGPDKDWDAIVTCVRANFSPFNIDIVTAKPEIQHTTVIVGGWAHNVGLDDKQYNGISPRDRGAVTHDQTSLVFSKVGPGEHDIENVCSTVSHEIGHTLGLDHELSCGDIMGFSTRRCGPRKFKDAEAPCGEGNTERACHSGDQTQNSYQKLGQLVGFRKQS